MFRTFYSYRWFYPNLITLEKNKKNKKLHVDLVVKSTGKSDPVLICRIFMGEIWSQDGENLKREDQIFKWLGWIRSTSPSDSLSLSPSLPGFKWSWGYCHEGSGRSSCNCKKNIARNFRAQYITGTSLHMRLAIALYIYKTSTTVHMQMPK